MTFRLSKEVALRTASILRNQGSASAAADVPENGSSGNLGLKTSLREVCAREPDGLLEEEAAAIAAIRRGDEEERECRGRTGGGEEGGGEEDG